MDHYLRLSLALSLKTSEPQSHVPSPFCSFPPISKRTCQDRILHLKEMMKNKLLFFSLEATIPNPSLPTKMGVFDTLSNSCVFFLLGLQLSFLKAPRVVEGEEFDEMGLNKLGGKRRSHGTPRLKAKEEMITTAPKKGGWGICKVSGQEEEMPHLLFLRKKLMVEPSQEPLPSHQSIPGFQFDQQFGQHKL